MRLFLDTEFNGFGGELISLALVAEDGAEWYAVRRFKEPLHPWVREHVMPFLYRFTAAAPLNAAAFTAKLREFLMRYNGAEIIADWPADFVHLCMEMEQMGADAGFMMPIDCTMRLTSSPELHPEVPHNALSDARALRDWYLAAH